MQQYNLDTSISSVLGNLPENVESMKKIMLNIIQYWLNEEYLISLHQEILSEHEFMAGRYRTLPISVRGLNLPLSYQVKGHMKNIFQRDLNSFNEIILFFVDVLQWIHPFQDGNRRTYFLALESQLIHIGYPVLNIWQLRPFWESIKDLNYPQGDRLWRATAFWEQILNLANKV